MLELGYD